MKIALFIPSMLGGGAERVILNLANGFSKHHGICVDLVLSNAKGSYLEQICQDVKIINLGNQRTSKSLYGLIKYINSNKPDILISAISHANVIAILSKIFTKTSFRLIVTQHTLTSIALKEHNKVFSYVFCKLISLFYPFADAVVAVSNSIKMELKNKFHIDANKIYTIYNPIVEKKIIDMSLEPLDHEWFSTDEFPVILSVGRLTHAKDFPTLLRAFKTLRRQMKAKLLILGEGELRKDLELLCEKLGIKDDVQMPGHVENPYRYMARASVFVLPSKYEGFGNVIVEAMACGTPVICTDCPGGPREILDNGKYGSLVPVGKPELLAKELLKVLNKSNNKYLMKERANDFSIENIINEYLTLIKSISSNN